VYVFASGNGGVSDNCNYDGYTNSPYTIAIGAIGRDGLTPWYQEPCAAQLAVAYTSNAAVQIVRRGGTHTHARIHTYIHTRRCGHRVGVS
jgi:hypothetical protein